MRLLERALRIFFRISTVGISMQIIRSHTFKRALAVGIGAAIGVLYAFSAIAANADTLPSVLISGNSQVSVHGASVTLVRGDEITAVSKWGTTKITWKIDVTNATRFSPERGESPVSAVVQVGETIGFSGLLDQRGGAFTVYPSTVRNESIIREASVLDGNIVEAATNSMLIQTENGTSTVLIGTGTIMTKDGNKVGLSDLALGATVKVFGTLNARDRVLTANRLIAVSEELPQIPNTGAPARSGWFTTLMTWIGRGGPLSAK